MPLGVPWSKRMRIGRSGRAHGTGRRIETAGGEFENRLNLLARHMKLFDDFQAIPPIGSVIYANASRTACYCVAGTAPFRSDCLRSVIFLNSNNSPRFPAIRLAGAVSGIWLCSVNLLRPHRPYRYFPKCRCPNPIPIGSFRRSCFQPENRCMLLKLRHRPPRPPPQTGFVSHPSSVGLPARGA